MGSLGERYPAVSQLPATDDLQELLKLLEPYFDWELLELDTHSSDILIGDLSKKEDPRLPGRLLILTGLAVTMWLQHQKP